MLLLRVGTYGDKHRGFVPLYVLGLTAGDFVFETVRGEGSRSYRWADGAAGFPVAAVLELRAGAPDPDMDHLNDFVLLCEKLERRLDCVSVQAV